MVYRVFGIEKGQTEKICLMEFTDPNTAKEDAERGLKLMEEEEATELEIKESEE